MDSFTVQSFIFFLPFFIIMFFWWKAIMSLFTLYRKKVNPDYPILPGETINYFDSPSRFLKIYATPFIMWKIILQRHKDKEINSAANKIRLLLFLFIGIMFLEMFVLTIIWGYYE